MAVSSSSAETEKKRKNQRKSKTDNKKVKTQIDRDDTATRTRTQCNNTREVRFNRGRICDSQSGKTCHQCRKKTMDFVVSCKKKTENRQCAIHFCHRCLLNRYGEKVEDVVVLHNWTCPRCRGICNCSIYMKKRGHNPSGHLVRVAKANGFSSVSEALHLENTDYPGSKKMKDVDGSLKEQKASNKEPAVSLGKRHREGNDFQRPSNVKMQEEPSKMNGVGIETRHSKLQRLRDNNGNVNASIEKKDAGSLSVESSPKRHPFSKAVGNGFRKPSNLKVQPKPSKVVGIETGNKKLKRLEDNKDAASIIRKCSPKRRQISKGALRGKEKIYRKDLGGQLIKMNSDMEVPKKNFQESISDHSETEVPKKVDVDDTVAKCVQVKGPHSCEKKNIAKVKTKLSDIEILLPHGIVLSNVASIDMPAEDVGHAIQFLEFCKAFGKILNLGKGQSEHFFRELASGRSKRRAHSSPIVKFHIQLLSAIQKDSRKEYPYFQNLGENSWFQALVKYASESRFYLHELQVDCFEVGDYDLLDVSKKLKLLNFLCDEALGTTDFRSWIDEQSKFVERDKKGKEKILAEKKNMKNKKQHNEIAKAAVMKNGAPLSKVAPTLRNTVEASEVIFNGYLDQGKEWENPIQPNRSDKLHYTSTQDAFFSLGFRKVMPKEEPRSSALRSEPMFLDEHGHKFWRLRCHSSEMNILLQDIEKGDPLMAERWYSYDIEQKAMVEKYICSFRYTKLL